MPTESEIRRAEDLLLTYLQIGKVSTWPGTDGMLIEDVLSYYSEAVVAREVPDCDEIGRLHADLVPALQALWARLDRRSAHKAAKTASATGEQPRKPDGI
jgi:hypothetical protein